MGRPAVRRLRRFAWTMLSLAVLALLLAWAWGQPFMASPRMLWDISRASPPRELPVPVQGVRARQIADTFGAPRGTDRTHQGVDIFAARGTHFIKLGVNPWSAESRVHWNQNPVQSGDIVN